MSVDSVCGRGQTLLDIEDKLISNFSHFPEDDKVGADSLWPRFLLESMLIEKRDDVERLCEIPSGVDCHVWLYEHLRQVTLELNRLVVDLAEVCTTSACPVMKATDEWVYLCAAHRQPQECSAMDYTLHTLDGTSALLNSFTLFPLRGYVSEKSSKLLQPTARRLYRIFSHAYFHHPDVFSAFESDTRLCKRFSLLCRKHRLLQPKLLLIPENAFTYDAGSDEDENQLVYRR